MKTITLRIEDQIYELLKKAADGERRSISNFIENASLQYLTNELYVPDPEMEMILNDPELTEGIYAGLDDVKKGKYKIVK